MLNAQKERRVVKLTNELWRAMQHYVVDNFGSNHFSVGAFLAQHFKSGSPMADHVFSRFMRQYERHSALNYPAKRSPQFKYAHALSHIPHDRSPSHRTHAPQHRKFCVEAVHFLAALWVWTNKTEENGEPRLPPIEGTYAWPCAVVSRLLDDCVSYLSRVLCVSQQERPTQRRPRGKIG